MMYVLLFSMGSRPPTALKVLYSVSGRLYGMCSPLDLFVCCLLMNGLRHL